MKKLYFVTFLFLATSFLVFAVENFQKIPSGVVETDFSSLSFRNDKMTLKKILSRKMGGDDVGNGGDEIRQKFLTISRQLLSEYSKASNSLQKLDEIEKGLTTAMILVVDDLKVKEIKIPAMAVQHYIFLDRATWNTVDGLLSDKLDPRLEIFRLLTDSFGLIFKDEELVRLYASLSFYTSPNTGEKIHATPWCPLNLSDEKIEKTPETIIQTSETDPEGLKAAALDVCEKEKKLNECRVLELKHGGFAMWVKYKVVVQGFSYKKVKLTKEDQLKEQCLELQRCSTLFELAPTGQISASGFSSLDEQINLSCQ